MNKVLVETPVKHKHEFEKDTTFNRRYCREVLYPRYPGFTWQSDRFVCKHCGKVKYEKTTEVSSFRYSDEMDLFLR